MGTLWLFVFALIFLLASCNSTKPVFSKYKESIEPITCLFKNENESVVLDDSTCNYLLVHSNKSIYIINVKLNTITDTILPPVAIKSFRNISFPSYGNFAICQNDGFWVYTDKKFSFHKFNLEKDSAYIFIGTKIQYFPNSEKIIVQTMPQNAKGYGKDLFYSWNMFRTFNLASDSSYKLDIIPHKKYWGMKLDIPYIYTSQTNGNKFHASFSYDRNFFSHHLETGAIKINEVKYEDDILNPMRTDNLKKENAKDAMQVSWVIDDAYYYGAFNEKTKNYFRIYKPKLPRQNKKGEFLGYMDKPIILIKQNSISQERKYYLLPSGVFLKPNDWYLSTEDDKLFFTKSIKIPNSEKFQILVYSFDLWDFE